MLEYVEFGTLYIDVVPAPAVVLIVAYVVFPIVAVVTLTLPFTKEAVVAFTAQDEVPYIVIL